MESVYLVGASTLTDRSDEYADSQNAVITSAEYAESPARYGVAPVDSPPEGLRLIGTPAWCKVNWIGAEKLDHVDDESCVLALTRYSPPNASPPESTCLVTTGETVTFPESHPPVVVHVEPVHFSTTI